MQQDPSVNGPLSEILGENTSELKVRLAQAMSGAQDISGLIKRKRPAEEGVISSGSGVTEAKGEKKVSFAMTDDDEDAHKKSKVDE